MAYDSWYCSLPGFISDRFTGCVPTAEDQVTIMRGNFGGSADPSLVEQTVSGYQDWLTTTGYDKTVQSLEVSQVMSSWMIGGIIFIGVMVLTGDGGPRRYGR